MSMDPLFDSAMREHQVGRLAQAEALYRQILSQNPRHAGALHLLGVLAYQVGQCQVAAQLIGQAIAVDATNPVFYSNLASVLRDLKRPGDAVTACRRSIALKLDYAEPHNNLGNALQDLGQIDEAIAAFRRAVELRPNYADAHNNLGVALHDTGKVDEAIAAYQKALSVQPNNHLALNNLGTAMRDRGQMAEALDYFRRSFEAKPDFLQAIENLYVALKDANRLEEALALCNRAFELGSTNHRLYNNRGAIYTALGRSDEAVADYEKAISIDPNFAEAHSNLGAAFQARGDFDTAYAHYHRALELKPNDAMIVGNMGAVLQQKGQFEEAKRYFRLAIDIDPNDPRAHWHMATTLLTEGDFEHGWEEYEWRWKWKDFKVPHANFTQPRWDGNDLAGRTILLHAEQGFGDAIQFVRYAPMVVNRGGRVVLGCPPPLRRLLSQSLGYPVVATGEPLPPVDLQCPVMSLARIFRTRIDSIPHDVPYLRAKAEDVDRWRHRLAALGAGLKVGLVWAGSKIHKNDYNRSMSLGALSPLAGVPGVTFLSLQKGIETAQIAANPQIKLVDWSEELNDFADTAALVSCLDLVISVDTAVVHLAGALGRPVWTLVAFVPDYRWMFSREDSPWYPTMRLFRQTSLGDWGSVVNRVKDALGQWANGSDATQ